MKELIHFDWAIKKLLRNKASFGVLEGFISELLGFDVWIKEILDSESNKETKNDKFNRVDILVETKEKKLLLIEVQNEDEVDYFQRMIYGISKLLVEHIEEGNEYGVLRKAYSINIVYFGLGMGNDYIYKYDGKFVGIHNKEVLKPSVLQQKTYDVGAISEIFPQYYLLRVNSFDDNAKNSLDEWIYFLKNSKIQPDFKAKGLAEARKFLDYENLSADDKKEYQHFMKGKRIALSELKTARLKGLKEGEEKGEKRGIKRGIKEGIKEGIKQGEEKGLKLGEEKAKITLISNSHNSGISVELIAKITNLSIEEVEDIISNL